MKAVLITLAAGLLAGLLAVLLVGILGATHDEQLRVGIVAFGTVILLQTLQKRIKSA